MNPSLTSSYTPPQATFVGKTRAFEPVEKTIVDYPLTIDVEPIEAPNKDKPDETRFIPTYDNQQRLANLTYSPTGDFVSQPQNVIEAQANERGVNAQNGAQNGAQDGITRLNTSNNVNRTVINDSIELPPVQTVGSTPKVASQQAINAFSFIANSGASSDASASAASVSRSGVDIFA